MYAVTQIMWLTDVTGDAQHPALDQKNKNVVEMKTLLLNLTQGLIETPTVLPTTKEKEFAVQDQVIVLLRTMVKNIAVETTMYQLQLALTHQNVAHKVSIVAVVVQTKGHIHQ